MEDIRVVTDFPRKVREIENLWITVPDGVKLAGRIWLPEDAETDPVPAILEYLPYRKRDGTVERDALTHPYLAGYGYAGVRVDMRGSGDREGLCKGEYLKQEQNDCLAVIEWLAKQPWCSGTVGMIGISWGGFNGLQVAARRPPALKVVISLCSTDDRFSDDIHYLGGAMHAVDDRNVEAEAPKRRNLRWRFPNSSPYVMVGASIHGLSTAYHLASALKKGRKGPSRFLSVSDANRQRTGRGCQVAVKCIRGRSTSSDHRDTYFGLE